MIKIKGKEHVPNFDSVEEMLGFFDNVGGGNQPVYRSLFQLDIFNKDDSLVKEELLKLINEVAITRHSNNIPFKKDDVYLNIEFESDILSFLLLQNENLIKEWDWFYLKLFTKEHKVFHAVRLKFDKIVYNNIKEHLDLSFNDKSNIIAPNISIKCKCCNLVEKNTKQPSYNKVNESI